MASTSVNANRARRIRQTALGKDMREPIVEGLKWGEVPLNALTLHARAEMVDSLKDGQEKLNQKKAWGNYQLNIVLDDEDDMLDDEVAKELDILAPVTGDAHRRLVPIDEKCDTRILSMAVTRFSKRSEYYTLSFTRANEQ